MSASVAWYGPPGCGKKTRLHEQLQALAKRWGVAYQVQRKQWGLKQDKLARGGISDDAATGDDDGEGGDSDTIPYEVSALHIGFDMYRMSMKDKMYMDSIISRITPGQNVCLAGQTDIPTILVLEHAHVMCDESLLLLHNALEAYGDKFIVWMTTEEPLPIKIADYFFIVPMDGPDRRADAFKTDNELTHGDIWVDWFRWRVRDALAIDKLTLDTVKMARAWVYTCMQRNLRWSQMIYYWFQAVMELELAPEDLKACLKDMLKYENTQAFSSLLSYRIPILWEAFFLGQIRALQGIKPGGE